MTTVLELKARLDNLLSTAQRETADIDLFAPIADREECPICLIPLPIMNKETIFMRCCGKSICKGCIFKHRTTELDENKASYLDDYKCAFCCQPPPKNDMKSLKKLAKKNNPDAFMHMATHYKEGDDGVFQSNTKSLEMRICAAELGLANAYALIGDYYRDGIAVERDMSKALEFWEVAAKKGSVHAHKCLAAVHGRNEDMQTCIRHYRVVANAGEQEAMDYLMKIYKHKLLTKDVMTQTLRAFQASNGEMKSKDRDDARKMNETLERSKKEEAKTE